MRIQMHFDGNLRLPQRSIVNQRVLYTVHRVILRLQQKRRRSLVGDMNIRIQLINLGVEREMPRIKSHGKIRAAAFFVCRIDSRVQTL